MNLGSFLILLILLIFSAILHEIAHAYLAYRLGDPTAKLAGRITLNPLKHLDPIGSVLLPLVLYLLKFPIIFAIAKPVPINPSYLKDPKKEMMFIGLAGPMTNLAIAIALSIILRTGFVESITPLEYLFFFGVIINIMLCIFNLVPIPPLDGSRIITGILPHNYAYYYAKLEPFGIVLLLSLFWFGLFKVLYKMTIFITHLFLGKLFEIYLLKFLL